MKIVKNISTYLFLGILLVSPSHSSEDLPQEGKTSRKYARFLKNVERSNSTISSTTAEVAAAVDETLRKEQENQACLKAVQNVEQEIKKGSREVSKSVKPLKKRLRKIKF